MEAKKVLIIDDDPLTCKLIAKVIKLQKYSPITVTNHLEVLDVTKSEKPSLILMDYHLGPGDGLEILQSLKANDFLKTIPVIITSGMNYRKESLEAGAHAFLLKPFDWKELMTIIKKLLNNL